MEIGDIIKDSFKYPFSDKKQFGFIFLVFVLLGIFIGVFFISSSILGRFHVSSSIILIAIILLFILSLIISIFLCGYQIDIIGVACDLEDDFPSFSPAKNIKNGLKLILVYLVFYVIAGIISTILMFLAVAFMSTGEIVGYSIAIIIYLVILIINILISWIFSMSLCRLAYHGSINEALDLKEAYQDLRKIGLTDMLIYVLVLGIIMAVIIIIALVLVTALLSAVSGSITPIISILILFALGSYLYVVQSRAIGLLYSKVIYE